ncbi:hypothetical protein ACWGSE_10790 [Streptomyces diastaticus]|uniref:hypothetical protein n=1 Tax=Streptomyces diastaticus TaxID=1956 RepID=UPI0035E30FD1
MREPGQGQILPGEADGGVDGTGGGVGTAGVGAGEEVAEGGRGGGGETGRRERARLGGQFTVVDAWGGGEARHRTLARRSPREPSADW